MGRPPLGGRAGAVEAKAPGGMGPDLGAFPAPLQSVDEKGCRSNHPTRRIDIHPGRRALLTGGRQRAHNRANVVSMVDHGHRQAAFFDLDKTIIARSSALAMGRPLFRGGLITRRDVLRSSYAQFVFLLGGADHDQMERMRRYLSGLCAGWDVSQVNRIISEALDEIIAPSVYAEAAQLIADHHLAGRDVIVVSTSGREVVEPIAAMVGADDVVATRMVTADGKYTGEIAFYAYAENKAAAIRELAETRGYDLEQCYAYSDSLTDIPMLETVGHPFAVNPDRGLRREAAKRDWPIVVFTQPVALRKGKGLASDQVRTGALAVAAATGVVVVGWWVGTRRHHGRAA